MFDIGVLELLVLVLILVALVAAVVWLLRSRRGR